MELPNALKGLTTQDEYNRWLHRRAAGHVRRDRKRGKKSATTSNYKMAIHQAVCDSAGKDAYTGELLDWKLLNQYNNKKSHKGKSNYKAKFSLLPTPDHVGNGSGPAKFKICAWRTNDAKNDLSLEDFVALCKKVVAWAKPK